MITRPELINNICKVANIQREPDNPVEGYFTRAELEKLYTFITILKDTINSKAGDADANKI